MMRAYEPNLGMKAHVNELVFITLVMMASGGLEILRCKLVLNFNFYSSFFFPLSLESHSHMIFLVRGYAPWRKGVSGGTVAS
jgi:hypothetical protein